MNDTPIDAYCVMGNPVEHSRSPWIHARFAELTGQHLRYDRQQVALDGFAQAVQAWRARGGRGCNVTIPFKFEAVALATKVSERAALAQAANTLSFNADGIHADNTDGLGLVADIENNLALNLRACDILLLGAGGAAAGALGPLLQARPRQVLVANRTRAKADALVQRHAALARSQGCELQACGLDTMGRAFDIVINASASSLGGGAVPIQANALRPGALAYDMMYGPAAAGFLTWARSHGARASDGLGMLVEQAAQSFFIWRGVRPPSAAVLAELRRVVDAPQP
ncbi:MAG: shikimate dehydrogenase [Burkholderiaceae bacterium]|nr:shikimate dehydrogenase [Burkholderiaceae bacterium]